MPTKLKDNINSQYFTRENWRNCEAIYLYDGKGKDIITTRWNDDGTTQQTILKWDGKRFNE